MAFDGIVTRAVVEELHHLLSTGRITKIHQPHKTELVLVIRANRKNYKVLLSMNAQYARIQLTDKTYENPQEPPTFCMLLRKHLDGAILESIEQIGFERIVHFNFRAKNDIGDDVQKTIIIETMGKHSNIILIDTASEKILDAMKRLSPAVNRHRTVLPGHTYVAPPDQHKLNPVTVTSDELLKTLDFNAGKLDHQLVNCLEGFSPLAAREVLHRAGLSTRERITSAFTDVQNEIKSSSFRPQIYRNSAHKDDFHVLQMTHLGGEIEAFDSPSEMLETFYTFKAETDLVRQRASDLGKIITNEKKKNERKLKKLRGELREAEDASHYQLYGELITAHMHAIKKGDRTAEVTNYYDENQAMITIPLDPNKTPSENAQKYFRKYNKLKTAKVEVEKHIESTIAEIAYLESVIQQIESASLKDITEIREELEAEGYVKHKPSKNRKQKPSKPTPEQYAASDGTLILVGKNNRQNEFLTMRMAGPNDTWLHTKDIPGSHVVIKSEEPSNETLLEAAGLAAFFSKAKLSSRVPVDTTLIKHVHKPNGAKPGYVIYDHQTTIFVTPDEHHVNQLKENAKG